MTTLSAGAVDLATGLAQSTKDIDPAKVDVAVCPPAVYLQTVAKALSASNIAVGAQNMYFAPAGAFTGELSNEMLKDAGCTYVIIGHSERRAYFGETNETVNKRIKATLANDLLPIMCVGETLEEREAKKTFDVVKSHVEGGLEGIDANNILKIVIAYEPVWAIGTGKTATPEQAEEVHKFIRGLLEKKYGKEKAEAVRIQYGGSVKPDNVEALLGKENIDGALVGGASLKIDSFSEMIKKASKL